MLRKLLGHLKKLRPTINDVRVVTIFTAVLALVAIFQLVLLYTGSKDTHDLAVAAKKQAQASHSLAEQASKQVDAMKSQNEKLQESLKETRALVAAEKSQAKSTRRLANASRQSSSNALAALHLAQQSDRAWLFINLKPAIPQPGTRIKVNATILNVGHTVAHIDLVNVAVGNPSIEVWEMSKITGRPPYPSNPKDVNSQSLLFPGQSKKSPLKEKQPLTFHAYNQALLGARNFYVWAKVKYRSAGDPKEHHTHVCAEWSPSYKQWESCSWYNNAD